MKVGLILLGITSLGVLTVTQIIAPALLVMVFSAVVHECGHVAALWAYGVKIQGVSVSARSLGILVDEKPVAALSAVQKSVVLWMGVAANLVLVAVASLVLLSLSVFDAQQVLSLGMIGNHQVLHLRFFAQGVVVLNMVLIWMALIPITISDGRRVLEMAVRPQESWYRKVLFRILSVMIVGLSFLGLLKGVVLGVVINGMYLFGFRRVSQTVDDSQLHVTQAPLWLARLNLVLYVMVILIVISAMAFLMPYPEPFFVGPS